MLDRPVWFPEPFIRATALCVVRRDNDLLVEEVLDPVKGVNGYRPLGGGIQFGECSADAAKREMREELGIEVLITRLLGTAENIFVHMGEPGHEIVFLYEADFPDAQLYDRDSFEGAEENGLPIRAFWKPLADFMEGREALYPDGLLGLLAEREAL